MPFLKTNETTGVEVGVRLNNLVPRLKMTPYDFPMVAHKGLRFYM